MSFKFVCITNQSSFNILHKFSRCCNTNILCLCLSDRCHLRCVYVGANWDSQQSSGESWWSSYWGNILLLEKVLLVFFIVENFHCFNWFCLFNICSLNIRYTLIPCNKVILWVYKPPPLFLLYVGKNLMWRPSEKSKEIFSLKEKLGGRPKEMQFCSFQLKRCWINLGTAIQSSTCA